jgi:hypothetical protein
MNEFVRGALTMASAVVAALFFRAWRDTRDRLFLAFSIAFWVLAIHWTLLAIAQIDTELHHYFYLTRALAFLLIAVAIADKNRRA